MEPFDLSGRTGIVTGGSVGIGYAIACSYARAGMQVVIANRSHDAGERAAAAIRQTGGDAVFVPLDVKSLDSIDAHVSAVMQRFGRIDVLVNSAGMIARKSAEEITEDDWDDVIDVNLKGVFFCSQRVGREMIAASKGSIINISSLRSIKMAPNRSVYAVSKAGVTNMTRALAYEWGRYGLRVNAIAPGTTITDINRQHFETHPDELADILRTIPRGRLGEVSDYCAIAAYLASGASDFMTGQTLYVDGGTTVC